MGVGAVVLDVIAGFLSGRVQRVVVDDTRSDNIRVVSGVAQVMCLAPCCFCCTLAICRYL